MEAPQVRSHVPISDLAVVLVIDPLIDAFMINKLMATMVKGRTVKANDETMSAFRPHTSKSANLPKHCSHKPEPLALETELRSTVDGATKIMQCLEMTIVQETAPTEMHNAMLSSTEFALNGLPFVTMELVFITGIPYQNIIIRSVAVEHMTFNSQFPAWRSDEAWPHIRVQSRLLIARVWRHLDLCIDQGLSYLELP